MAKRTLEGVDVRGKRVLVRVDFNVPLADGDVTDDTRIRAHLPLINDLRNRGAKVILMSHLGRPKGKINESLRLAPVADRLRDLIGQPVKTVPSVIGQDVSEAVQALQNGDVLLLENVRFEPGEEKNDPELAAELAKLGDIYVNDAFGSAHRAHASTEGVAHLLPAYAGPLLNQEVSTLTGLLERPERPFIAILGGAKVSDKLAVMAHLAGTVDVLLLGGGMANTLLLARGAAVGQSLVEESFVEEAKQFIDQAESKGTRIVLPTDVRVATSLDDAPKVVGTDSIGEDQAIFDIGPETEQRYAAEIAKANTIFWNGPMGVFEREAYSSGTFAIARAVAESDATSVVGGGDSIAAITQAGVTDAISHISTGGGASLELLEGKQLPGVSALPDEG